MLNSQSRPIIPSTLSSSAHLRGLAAEPRLVGVKDLSPRCEELVHRWMFVRVDFRQRRIDKRRGSDPRQDTLDLSRDHAWFVDEERLRE